VDGFIFNSQTTKGVVNGLIVNERPSLVAYPPTDRFGEPISEEEIKTRAEKDPLQILFLGNIIKRKGLHALLKAVSLQRSAVRLDIVGSLSSEPQYARKMQEYVANNNLSSLVTFYSTLDNEFLAQKLQQAHILIVPSSYEGFGIVYLEGMGFGLPAIGTTAGAAGEIITDNETGFLIEPTDATTLAQRIASLAQDRALLVRLSINARKRYLEQPAWNDTAGKIRTYLQNMIR
jgi:glycosyltransferase involved in cell wall biosynthesis